MADRRATWSINPVALAELITGVELTLLTVEKDPGQDGDLARVRAMLEKAFAIRGEVAAKLEFIFESDGKTPARLDVLQQLADSLNEPKKLAEILQQPLVRAAIELFGDEKIRIVLPFLGRVSDASFAAPGEEIPAGNDAVVGRWRPLSAPDYVIGDVSYLDPKQGSVADCYLISSMIALAWSRPDKWVAQVKKTGAPYHYPFYNGPEVVDEEATKITPKLPRTKSNSLAYARSSTNNAEGWPGMFEKAYLIRTLQQLREGLIPPDYEPSPSDYHELDNLFEPQVACQTLVGGTQHSRRSDGNPSASAWLRTHCTNDVTTEPTIAWTWETTQEAHGLGWSQTGLNHNHAYAVLGVIGDKPDYVVLRNPWGVVWHSDGNAKGNHWNPGNGAAFPLNSHGVFALRAEWFDKCMQAVGWVTP